MGDGVRANFECAACFSASASGTALAAGAGTAGAASVEFGRDAFSAAGAAVSAGPGASSLPVARAADAGHGSVPVSAAVGTVAAAGAACRLASAEGGGGCRSTRFRIAFAPRPIRRAERAAPTQIRLGVAVAQLTAKSANPRPAGKSRRTLF
jgi:hypothetical protein